MRYCLPPAEAAHGPPYCVLVGWGAWARIYKRVATRSRPGDASSFGPWSMSNDSWLAGDDTRPLLSCQPASQFVPEVAHAGNDAGLPAHASSRAVADGAFVREERSHHQTREWCPSLHVRRHGRT